MSKTVKLFNDDFNIKLTDIRKLKFLEVGEDNLTVKANTVEVNGTDGVLMGPSNFGPFNIVLKFSYLADDIKDSRLMKQQLRNILFVKDPYYLWHSDAPGLKYAVYAEEINFEESMSVLNQFSVTFVVYKGYSESYRDTTDIKLLQEYSQFGQGLEVSNDISYKHNTKTFKIFNGSTEDIDPTLRHKLIIKSNMEAPNGFKITNKTTSKKLSSGLVTNVFEYKKAIKRSQTFLLNGVYPYVNNKRVGVDTNYGYISLAKGWNEIVVEGDGLEKIDIEFIFNYIFR